ncbi:MAG: hypothetical protein RTU30_04810 [Candidatus Thorarchaeota archaeon]
MKAQRNLGSHAIYIDTKEIGRDLLITIYGGDEHHVGGVSIAYPTKSHYRDADTVSVSTLSFPGHKDYVVSNSAADRICKALHRPVIVTVGIHVDNATKEQIEQIVTIVESFVDEVITHYDKAKV